MAMIKGALMAYLVQSQVILFYKMIWSWPKRNTQQITKNR